VLLHTHNVERRDLAEAATFSAILRYLLGL
jgi:hypothetical protein